MAIEVIKMLTDDLTHERLGEDGGETVVFSIDGATWEVDLAHARASELRDMLRKYQVRKVTVGRTHTRRRGSGTRTSTGNAGEAAAIREWAVAEGLLPEGQRGRIKAEVREAYANRNQPKLPTPAPEAKAEAKKTQPKKEAAAAAS
jgi:hypothetical protein